MVLFANLNTETREWSSKFENYRVLIGFQADIDHCNNKIKENLPAEGALYTVKE